MDKVKHSSGATLYKVVRPGRWADSPPKAHYELFVDGQFLKTFDGYRRALAAFKYYTGG